jgi:hypothetical protein
MLKTSVAKSPTRFTGDDASNSRLALFESTVDRIFTDVPSDVGMSFICPNIFKGMYDISFVHENTIVLSEF